MQRLVCPHDQKLQPRRPVLKVTQDDWSNLPHLLQQSKPVEDPDSLAIKRLLADMQQTLEYEGGQGLAAIQVGVPVRIFLSRLRLEEGLYAPIRYLINPVIVSRSPTMASREEGCLSLPEARGYSVPRHTGVVCHYIDEKGLRREKAVADTGARILQHEEDHLNGKLFIEHLTEEERGRVIPSYFRHMGVGL